MPDPTLPIIEAIAKEPGLIREIYGDLAKPGVSQVGKALGAILGLGGTILWPVMLVNERASMALRANLDKYRQQLENTPPEEIVEVPPEIGVPIAEKLAYVTDEDIGRLYVALLANASTFARAKFAHPSFTKVIDSLSPDEGKLLRHFNRQLPAFRVRLMKDGTKQWLLGSVRMLTGLEFKANLALPENIDAYLDNLERLGIITLSDTVTLTDLAEYAPLRRDYEAELEAMKTRPNHTPKLIEGTLTVTPFGQLFLNACSIAPAT